MATSVRVMVLDDDADIRDLLDELLREEGYEVAACATTSEADARLAVEQPALLLLDLRLGGESGIAWLARRRQENALLPPIVAMSGDALSSELRAQLQLADAIEKPFDMHRLLACVAQHIRPQPHTRATSSVSGAVGQQ